MDVDQALVISVANEGFLPQLDPDDQSDHRIVGGDLRLAMVSKGREIGGHRSL